MTNRIRVRDRRGGDRYFIDNALLRDGWCKKGYLGPYGLAVYNVLCLHADADLQQSYPSYKTIGLMVHISPRQVKREIAKLVKFNIISKASAYDPKTGKQISNLYDLTHKSLWGDSESPGEGDSLSPGGCQRVTGEGDSLSPKQDSCEQNPENKPSFDYLDHVVSVDPEELKEGVADSLAEFGAHFSKYSSEGPELWKKEMGRYPDAGKTEALRELAQQPFFDPDSFAKFVKLYNRSGGYMYNISQLAEGYENYTQGKAWETRPKKSASAQDLSNYQDGEQGLTLVIKE